MHFYLYWLYDLCHTCPKTNGWIPKMILWKKVTPFKINCYFWYQFVRFLGCITYDLWLGLGYSYVLASGRRIWSSQNPPVDFGDQDVLGSSQLARWWPSTLCLSQVVEKKRPFPGVLVKGWCFPQIALAIWGSYFKLGGEGSQILWIRCRGGAVTQCVVSRCNQGSGVCRSKRGLSRRVSLVSSHACTGGGSQYYLYIYILYHIYVYVIFHFCLVIFIF